MASRALTLLLLLVAGFLLSTAVGTSADKPRQPPPAFPTPPGVGLGGGFGGNPGIGAFPGNPGGGLAGCNNFGNCLGGVCGLGGSCTGSFGTCFGGGYTGGFGCQAFGGSCCNFGAFQAPPSLVRTMAFSPDGKTLASVVIVPTFTSSPGPSATTTGSYVLVDTTTGKSPRQPGKHPGVMDSLAFSPEGKALATGGVDGTVLWDRVKGTEIKRFKGSTPVFSWTGKALATEANGTVHVWEVASGKELARLGPGPTSRLWPVAFSRDGRSLILTSAANQLVLTNLDKGGDQKLLTEGDERAFALSPDGKFLATVGPDSMLRLRDLPSGRDHRHFNRDDLRRRGVRVAAVAFFADGKTLVAAGADGKLHLWEVATGKEVTLPSLQAGSPEAILVAPDGRSLATRQPGLPARVHDVSLIVLRSPPKGRPAPATLDRLWEDLGNADSTRGYQALYLLGAYPKEVVPFLRDKLRAVPREATRNVAALIADLDDDDFVKRKKASAELERLGELALPALQRSMQGRPSPEVCWRVDALLDKLQGKGPSADALRALRATAVLEYAGTPEARKLLEALADGAPEALLTLEAQASLERLHRRQYASREQR